MTTEAIQTRTIPSSGLPLPVIGCGTWKGFDIGTSELERKRLASVLANLFTSGGTVVDSSPMYGRAEAVVGDLLTFGSSHANAFVATKVWTQGREAGITQMKRSMKLLQRSRIDLMQVHNLVDWQVHLSTLERWKAEGLVSYIGITHYTSTAFADLESIMRSRQIDFVQLNYSLDDRAAEQRLLPLAMDRGIAVLVNVPFGAGRLLHSLHRKPLPPWASGVGCTTWSQLLLKFVLAHPAVTCAIPGTGNPEHMADNCRAGVGPALDEAHSNQLKSFWEASGR